MCLAAGGRAERNERATDSPAVTVTTATNNARRPAPGHGGRGRRRFRRRGRGPDRAGRGRGVHQPRRSTQPVARREAEGAVPGHAGQPDQAGRRARQADGRGARRRERHRHALARLVPAVVMAWYPGQRGGAALASCSGARRTSAPSCRSPGRRRSTTTTPGTATARRVFDYHVGYSWFDYRSIEPLYAFGHGLSYTKFEYRKLQLGCSEMSKGAVLPVVVNVENTGTVAGDEIVMVWVRRTTRQPTARRPAKELKGFTRVHLAPASRSRSRFPSACRTSTTSRWIPRGRRPASGSSKPATSRSRSVAAPRTAADEATVNVNGY